VDMALRAEFVPLFGATAPATVRVAS